MQIKSVPVRVIQDTSESIVPGQERRQQCEEAPSLFDREVDPAFGVRVQVRDSEEQESHVKGEEQGEERNRRAQSR